MALIECSECGKQVSSNAQACPNCGNPMAGAVIPQQTDRPSREKIQTIEQTGKQWKGLILVGWILAIFGTFVAVAGAGTPGVVMAFSGLACVIIGHVAGWWYHG